MTEPFATTGYRTHTGAQTTRCDRLGVRAGGLAVVTTWRLKGLFAASILAIVILSAFVGNAVWRVDPSLQQLSARLLPPMSAGSDGVTHVFGTDHLGRDLLARTLAGARISLLLTLFAVGATAVVGVGVGLVSGVFGGRVDQAFMTCADVQLALPFTLLAISVSTITGPSVVTVIAILTATGWVAFARVVRSQVLSLREMDFIFGARSLGCGPWRILLRHLLPNCASTIIVLSSFTAARLIVAEATISFLGVGVPSWIPSWGSMISEGRTYLPVAWWVAIIPGAAITTSVIAINLLGDWLRDRLDPRLATGNGRTDIPGIQERRRGEAERAPAGGTWRTNA